MARQPTSMIGHMYAAAQRSLRIMAAPVTFVGRAVMQAAERLIPQGAAEIGQALYGKSDAYAPPGLTEKHAEQEKEAAPVAAKAAAPAPAPKPPTVTPTQAMTASTYLATTPPESAKKLAHEEAYFTKSEYGQRLDQQAARMTNKSNQQERGR